MYDNRKRLVQVAVRIGTEAVKTYLSKPKCIFYIFTMEGKTINDFIKELQSISEDKRNLPLIIQCPNGLEVYPSIKMKFENYGSPLLGDKLESMMITWKD